MASVYNLCAVLMILLLHVANSEDFITCGGFVQSDIEINFSKIEVKLYTPQGALKYQTDCAPNNGYFMVPIYDMGSFILKLEPPKGWMFEPSSVAVDIDGETDKCSRGEDINFRFIGFTVKGKVTNKGQMEGPAGVTISMAKTGSNEVIAEVISNERGLYEAPNILPGDYTLTAKHPTWKFVEPSFPFTISKDVTTIDKQVQVKGYDINGRVESDGEPVRGVMFVLLSESVSKEDVSDCDQTVVSGFKVSTKKKQLCHVQSDQDGNFIFPSVPAGDYTMIPFYQGEHITFDVLPSSLDVTVSFDSLRVPNAFKVEGFSVTGRVLTSAEGSGIGAVAISVQGRKDVKTKSDGVYKLEKIKSGTYTLTASSEHVVFEPATVKITPNTPRLPDILAIKFSVCGKVEVDSKSGVSLGKRRVLLNPTKQGNAEAVSTSTDSHGKFCFQVKPGEYVLTPIVTDAETKKGLKIIPDSQSLTVTTSPILDISFTQFKAKVGGSVTCIGICGKMEVLLVPVDPAIGEAKTVKVNQDSKKATFQLQNVLPGKYHANIVRDKWCWDKESIDVVVTDSDVTGVAFKQTGFQMLCETTHPATMKYKHQKSSKDGTEVDLKMGTKSICLAKPGVYKLTVESCHQFEKDQYTFDTASSSPVSLIAVKHRVMGRITAIVSATDIKVKVRSRESNEEVTVTPKLISPKPESADKTKDANNTEPVVPEGPFIYEFAYYSSNGDLLTIKPISSQILFYPAQTEVVVKSRESCPGIITEFEGRPGKFISGVIDPPLEGVSITLIHLPESAPFQIRQSSPYLSSLDGLRSLQITDNPADFKAKKLGEITIVVTDDNGSPLSGVLLSISGGSFRSNNLTEASGSSSSTGLSSTSIF
ncbi:putative nodal modulator 1 [Apostichopus japonicus]|uniref:Putative nodal modulator 1 n=1 Tax=Stichopus japonicus TaxID=307972 RepID=A0A2G8LI56_STIJA|nr:putative nodal modulator 1 [Apostichopus japonicus]